MWKCICLMHNECVLLTLSHSHIVIGMIWVSAGPGWSGFGRVEGYDAVNVWFVFRNKLAVSRLFECKNQVQDRNSTVSAIMIHGNLFIHYLSHKQFWTIHGCDAILALFSLKVSVQARGYAAGYRLMNSGSAPELRSVCSVCLDRIENLKTETE